MTHLTDDELGDVLTETFAAHEHLADPDVAVAIARAPGRPRHVGRVLLGAAAAVTLVAGGTTYVVSQRPDATRGHDLANGTATLGPLPPLPKLETDAENRAKATAAALSVIAHLPTYPGAQPTGRILGFGQQGVMIATTPGYTVTKTRSWRVGGSDAQAVARWYAVHPPRGFESESGEVVNSSSDGTTTVYAADFSQPGDDGLPPRDVTIEVDTVEVPHGVGIRASVLSVWQPARPLASYVQDATSIDVQVTHTTFAKTSHTTRRSFTIDDPKRVRGAEIAFNSLEGTGPVAVSCPLKLDTYRDRIVFHTPYGDVVVTTGGSCVDIATVQRAGKVVGPGLAYDFELPDSLDIH